MTDLPFLTPPADPTAIERPPRKCRRHRWEWTDWMTDDSRVLEQVEWCSRCHKVKDAARSRRNRNNGKRGRSDELTVAKLVGGRKVGPLGHSWDVEIPGYARLQAKQLDRWPSLNQVIEWLDAIPEGNELRGVTLADTPGPGKRTLRLVVFDLAEWARWHGGKE